MVRFVFNFYALGGDWDALTQVLDSRVITLPEGEDKFTLHALSEMLKDFQNMELEVSYLGRDPIIQFGLSTSIGQIQDLEMPQMLKVDLPWFRQHEERFNKRKRK